MSADIAKINAADAMKSVTLNVKVDTRELRVRLWIGTRLLHLAAWILGCRIRIEPRAGSRQNDGTVYPPLPEPLPPPPPAPPGERWRK
jgi:hypothetical protein